VRLLEFVHGVVGDKLKGYFGSCRVDILVNAWWPSSRAAPSEV
jgi:hypothetical protein